MLFSGSLLYTHFRKMVMMFWDVERKKASDLDDYITEGYLCYLYIYLLKIQDQIQIINGIQKKKSMKISNKKKQWKSF